MFVVRYLGRTSLRERVLADQKSFVLLCFVHCRATLVFLAKDSNTNRETLFFCFMLCLRSNTNREKNHLGAILIEICLRSD